MRYMIGYQLQESGRLLNEIVRNKEKVHEVYFAWGNMPSGRGGTASHSNLMPYEALQVQLAQLRYLADQGVGMNMLLNANCYGKDSLSRRFLMQTGDLISDFQEKLNLGSITTTSPVIARFVKENFPELEVRASVNMEIGTVEGMQYLSGEFDSFYYKRELNRNMPQLKKLKRWADNHGKKLYMLANSGCLNFCSARQFHDNLVAHEQEIVQMDNGAKFTSMCSRFVQDEHNKKNILRHLNCVRPEEMYLFEDLVVAAKLATRISPRPEQIVRAYMDGTYHGNLLELLEPSHAGAFYPVIVDNGKLPKDYCKFVSECSKDCENCTYCPDALEKACVNLDSSGVLDINHCEEKQK